MKRSFSCFRDFHLRIVKKFILKKAFDHSGPLDYLVDIPCNEYLLADLIELFVYLLPGILVIDVYIDFGKQQFTSPFPINFCYTKSDKINPLVSPGVTFLGFTRGGLLCVSPFNPVISRL